MRLRTPAALASSAAILALLGGCFLLPTADEQRAAAPTPTADAAGVTPEVGDCWQGEYTSFQNWDSWHGDPAVDCDERHQSYTFAISDAFEDAGDTYPFGGFELQDSAPIAYDACSDLLTDFVGVELSPWARMESSFFAPSAREWNHGARWLRCDLTVVKLGTSIYEGELQRLPDDAADLVSAVEENADAFDFCIDTTDGWYDLGPYYSTYAVYSDCAGDPMWRLLDVAPVPWDYGSDYPGDAAIQEFVSDTCFGGMNAAAPFAADYPDEEFWNDGYVSVSCWRYEWEVPADASSPI